MELTFTTRRGEIASAESDALIIPIYSGDAIASDINAKLGGQLVPTLAAAKFTGKRDDLAAFRTFGLLPATLLVLTGVGERTKSTGEAIRRAYGSAARRARDEGARTLAAMLPDNADAETISAVVEGITLALYRFTTYKSDGGASRDVESVELWSEGAIADDAVEHGRIVAAAVSLARDVVNTISNEKTPAEVAAWAQRVARESGLPTEVLDEKALTSGGYSSIIAVGKGSAAPPRLVEILYEPKGRATKTVALVGKTITFDSGGLDLKSRDNMYSMKNDLGGGAAVLGAMYAVAKLKPNVRVIGIMSAAENMPSGTAMRPSDVVRALNGKTFEIGNTDAEGRMVLADAVTHAARAGADEIISVATLTGGVFGTRGAAALGNDQALMDRFLAVADAAGERVWQLPLWEEYREDLHSDIADIKSTGSGRGAGTITAAMFIGEFVEEKPWLHLDIAMIADTTRELPYTPIGATGVMVRSLIRYLESA